MPPYNTSDAFSYLTKAGLPPHQAAALVGNLQQESSMNPAALNQDEGAYGLMQWRQGRRQGLEDFAGARGSSSSDPQTQLDYALHEMRGPEAKAGGAFLASPDLQSANAALKGFIRYGDDSQGTRLANAQALMGGVPAAAGAPSPAPAAAGGLLGNLGTAPAAEKETDTSGLFANLAPAAMPKPAGLLSPMGFLPSVRRYGRRA